MTLERASQGHKIVADRTVWLHSVHRDDFTSKRNGRLECVEPHRVIRASKCFGKIIDCVTKWCHRGLQSGNGRGNGQAHLRPQSNVLGVSLKCN